MGQQVAAIVYGVPEDAKCSKLRDEDGEWISEPDVDRFSHGENHVHVIGVAIAVQNVCRGRE